MNTSDEAVRAIAEAVGDGVEADKLAIERTLRDMGVGEAFEAAAELRKSSRTVYESKQWDAALAKVLRGGK